VFDEQAGPLAYPHTEKTCVVSEKTLN